jgi:hypothetical protein
MSYLRKLLPSIIVKDVVVMIEQYLYPEVYNSIKSCFHSLAKSTNAIITDEILSQIEFVAYKYINFFGYSRKYSSSIYRLELNDIHLDYDFGPFCHAVDVKECTLLISKQGGLPKIELESYKSW